MEVRGVLSVVARVALSLCLAVLAGISSSSHSADVTYEYDAAGRLRKSTYYEGTAVTYTLDAAGNRTSVVTTTSPGTLKFDSGSYTIGEDVGTLSVYVTRTAGAYGAVSISYATANSSAVAGQDYTATSGTLNWPNGDMSPRAITIPILWDSVAEGNEQFTVTLSSPGGGVALGSPSVATVTITNVEYVPPSLTFVGTLYGAYYDDGNTIAEGYLSGFMGSLSPSTTSNGYTITGYYHFTDVASGSSYTTLSVAGPGGAYPSYDWLENVSISGGTRYAPADSWWCDFGSCNYMWYSNPYPYENLAVYDSLTITHK